MGISVGNIYVNIYGNMLENMGISMAGWWLQ